MDSAARGERPPPTPTGSAPDTATIATPNGPVVLRADSAPSAAAVPSDRLDWTAAIVTERLGSLGLAPQPAGEARVPFLDLPGQRITLAGGRAEVQAFILGDAEAVQRATAGLDTVRVAPPNVRLDWPMPPSLVVSNNLVAIVLTRDPALRDSIRYALTLHQR